MNRHIERLLKRKVAFVGSEFKGKPYIKAMLVSEREGGNVFYFDTNHSTARVAQWRENPNACVYFSKNSLPVYRGVMLNGTIELTDDAERKKRHWNIFSKIYYPNGVTDPDYCIAKFTAQSGRYYAGLKSEDVDFTCM